MKKVIIIILFLTSNLFAGSKLTNFNLIPQTKYALLRQSMDSEFSNVYNTKLDITNGVIYGTLKLNNLGTTKITLNGTNGTINTAGAISTTDGDITATNLSHSSIGINAADTFDGKLFLYSGTDNWMLRHVGSTNAVELRYNAGASAALSIDTSNNATITGNATINGGSLNVVSPIHAYIYSQGADTYDGQLRLYSGSDYWWIRNVGTGNNFDVTYNAGSTAFSITTAGNAWFVADVSALTIIDRTPYPDTKEEAYSSVMSMQRKPTGGVDHEKLNKFIKVENKRDNYNPVTKSTETIVEYGRNLSATVSAQNEVIKDLVERMIDLEQQVIELKVRK